MKRRKPIAAKVPAAMERKPEKKRRKPFAAKGPRRYPIAAKGPKSMERKPEEKRRSNADRSAYFARREAAKVLRSTLHGDARRRAVGSIKSLVYSPSIRNKKATFALVCQTLKRTFAALVYLKLQLL